MAAIKIEDICFAYDGKPPILQDINLLLFAGEKVGLIGGNGSGKTSLFLTVCGILTPKYGSIYLFDELVKPGKFYPEIGFIFQNPDDQLFCPTVRDDIVFGLENLGLRDEEIERRVAEILALTGVTELADRAPHQLSGGEKCMVAIAAVLAMRPQILLYDEPSASLDLRARRRLIEFLKSCQQTIWVASHDLELILEVCDRAILLHRGQVVADGCPRTLLADRALMADNGLEVPLSLRGSEGRSAAVNLDYG